MTFDLFLLQLFTGLALGSIFVLLALGLSMGQWLSLPMIAAGIALYAWSRRQP